MADVDNGDIIRIGSGLIFDGLYDVVNVWHALTETTVGRTWAQLETAVQTWLEGIYTGLKAPLNDTIGTGSVSVANVTQATTLGSIPWSPTWAGVESGEQTAAGVCCFTWARTYKPRVQIRKYFGVFGEVNVTTGSWTSTVRNACEAALLYAITARSVESFTNFQAVAYNRDLATYQLGVSVDSSAEPAYQRRRKRGRGS